MNLRTVSIAFLVSGSLAISPLRAADEDLINADRPGIADGSATLDANQFQIEAGFQQNHVDSGGATGHEDTTPTLLRYGLRHDLELRIETSGYAHNRTGADTSSGLSPLSAGFKYRFREQPDGTLEPSVALIARLFPPSGSSDFRSQHFAGDVRVVADLNLNDHWSINPNVGVAFGQDASGRALTSALGAFTLTWSFTPHFQTFADLGLTIPEARNGGTSLQADGGLTLIIGRNTQLDVAFGPGLSGSTTPTNFWTAGISQRF
jgi:hypothetical protein